jgi:hypothetical protein
MRAPLNPFCYKERSRQFLLCRVKTRFSHVKIGNAGSRLAADLFTAPPHLLFIGSSLSVVCRLFIFSLRALFVRRVIIFAAIVRHLCSLVTSNCWHLLSLLFACVAICSAREWLRKQTRAPHFQRHWTSGERERDERQTSFPAESPLTLASCKWIN